MWVTNKGQLIQSAAVEVPEWFPFKDNCWSYIKYLLELVWQQRARQQHVNQSEGFWPRMFYKALICYITLLIWSIVCIKLTSNQQELRSVKPIIIMHFPEERQWHFVRKLTLVLLPISRVRSHFTKHKYCTLNEKKKKGSTTDGKQVRFRCLKAYKAVCTDRGAHNPKFTNVEIWQSI